MSDAGGNTNAAIIGVGTLSIVSTVGMIGTCLWNHREMLLQKIRCVISFNQDDAEPDLEAQNTQAVAPVSQPAPAAGPSITFPIIINNSSGLEGRQSFPISVPFVSPFNQQASGLPLERHYSDPTMASSDATSEGDRTSNESPPVLYRHEDGYQTS